MHRSNQTSDIRGRRRHLRAVEPPGDPPGEPAWQQGPREQQDTPAQPAVGAQQGGRAALVPVRDTQALADGSQLRIRPLGAGDREGLAGLFARMSPQSRHTRFLTPKPELSPRDLTFLTTVDHVGHEALVAVDERDGSIVGVARYVCYRDRPGVADVAFEVADELQGRGIGTLLARRLIERAYANGFELLEATTLWENRPARALLRRLGFQARTSQGTEIGLELALASRPR